MKSIAFFIITILLCCGTEARNVTGRVSCEGKGVAGVVVSDGTFTTRTDSKGNYSIDCNCDSRFIFISTPAGYTSGSGNGTSSYWQEIDKGNRRYDFTLFRKTHDDTKHHIIAIADPQVHDRTEFEMLAKAAEDIAGTVETFGNGYTIGIGCGDIVSHDHGFYPAIDSILAKSGIEFRHVIGNHDMKVWGRSYETSLEKFENNYGPSYYSFNIGKIHYVMLDDTFFIGRDYFYIGYIDERQLQWLENDLSHIPAGSTVIVTMHIPTTLSPQDRERFNYDEISTTLSNKKALYDILSPYKVHIISGHMHRNTNQVINENIFEHNIAALSGAWWCGDLCTDGTPAGYKVFDIDGDRISWRYKCLGKNDRSPAKVYFDSKKYEGTTIANIWDYDPSWKVEYFEDGKKICDMEQFCGKDSDAAEMYSERSRLKHKWITVSENSHLFKAQSSLGAMLLEVRVTDRFGHVWSAFHSRHQEQSGIRNGENQDSLQ